MLAGRRETLKCSQAVLEGSSRQDHLIAGIADCRESQQGRVTIEEALCSKKVMRKPVPEVVH